MARPTCSGTLPGPSHPRYGPMPDTIDDRLSKGRLLMGLVLFMLIVASLHSLAIQYRAGDTVQTSAGWFPFGLNFFLCSKLWRGRRWAAILLGFFSWLACLGGIYAIVWFVRDPRIEMLPLLCMFTVIPFTCAWALTFSGSLEDYVYYRRTRRLRGARDGVVEAVERLDRCRREGGGVPPPTDVF